ncbi:MAG: XdhC family protein, partial [Gaiellales bacterium]
MNRTADIARIAADLALRGQPYVLATVVRAEAPASVRPGAQAIVHPAGRGAG